MTVVSEIVQPTLADQVHRRLVSALVNGDFAAGDRLVMDRLAESFGVSRTPIRDALARLERDGLVVPASRGYEVRHVSDADVDAIYEARIAVEGHSARLLGGVGNEALAPVRAVIDAIVDIDMSDAAAAFWANRDIHRTLVAATGNEVLVRCFDDVWNSSVSAFAFGQLHRSAVPSADVVRHHHELLDVISSTTPDVAHSEMIRHLVDGRHRIGY